jgi:Zn-dependent protease with chaperone function
MLKKHLLPLIGTTIIVMVTRWLLLHWGIENYAIIVAKVTTCYVATIIFLEAMTWYITTQLPDTLPAPPNLYLSVITHAKRHGIDYSDIKVVIADMGHGSPTSSLNFMGRRIVAIRPETFDSHPADQVTALCLHEVGHLVHRHHAKLLLWRAVATTLTVLNVVFFLNYAAAWPVYLQVAAAVVVYRVVWVTYKWAITQQQHAYEYQADAFAASAPDMRWALLSALKASDAEQATDTHPSKHDRVEKLQLV